MTRALVRSVISALAHSVAFASMMAIAVAVENPPLDLAGVWKALRISDLQCVG